MIWFYKCHRVLNLNFSSFEDELSPFKQLRGGAYIVDQLPMTSSGKVSRRLAREIAIEAHKKRRSHAASQEYMQIVP